MWIDFGTALGQRITMGNLHCQFDFDGTLCGLFWTNIKIANGWLSVYVPEFDKKRPRIGIYEAEVVVENHWRMRGFEEGKTFLIIA